MSAAVSERAPAWLDWLRVAGLVLTSREIDRVEETELVPNGLVTYQFSARGHELGQVLLSLALDHPRDAAAVYYRSRPFVLGAGLTPEEAMAASVGRAGSPNEGRDIGVVHALPSRGRATVLPASGDVGAQYAVAVGWANAIRYRVQEMGEAAWDGALAAALGGDGSTATGGFWSALNNAATTRLPYLFFIEDNGYAISVPVETQTPGADLAANLAAFRGLRVLAGDGTDPLQAAQCVEAAVAHVRSGAGPALLRLTVPRLCGHSFADNQAYKPAALRQLEEETDPLPRLRSYLLEAGVLDQAGWQALEAQVAADVAGARERALAQPPAEPVTARRHVFFEADRVQTVGGARSENAHLPLPSSSAPEPAEPVRMNTVDAVRRALEHELAATPRLLVFGEDVGPKGGVHGATRDLQARFGQRRVFDTSLNEEGIIGRATGLALAGLIPVPEIQFRKYADPATEQLNDAGTVRWRTAGRFAVPMVVRIPVGVSRATGDPWHSVCAESVLAHGHGWRVAYPSNASDAVGLLRTALRGDDPTFFLEHRALYDAGSARRPYPGHDYALPFGRAAVVRPGRSLSVVTWGLMVHRSLEAAGAWDDEVEIVDLRTIVPWDREAVLESVRRTGRCLVVHEDNACAGFGAEVAALVADKAFEWLDAPVRRLAAADCPVPYEPGLTAAVVPTVAAIRAEMELVLAY